MTIKCLKRKLYCREILLSLCRLLDEEHTILTETMQAQNRNPRIWDILSVGFQKMKKRKRVSGFCFLGEVFLLTVRAVCLQLSNLNRKQISSNCKQKS